MLISLYSNIALALLSREIDKYLIKNKFQSHQYSFLLVDSLLYLFSTESHALDTWKLEKEIKQPLIQLRIYDNKGIFFNAYAQCYGPLKKLNILDSNPPRIIPHLPNNQNLKFEHEFELWEIDEATKQKIIAESKMHTYTFVLYWNIWTNYYSKVVFKEIMPTVGLSVIDLLTPIPNSPLRSR